MSIEPNDPNESNFIESFHRGLGFLNDLLLIPMFASLIFDGESDYHIVSAYTSNLIF